MVEEDHPRLTNVEWELRSHLGDQNHWEECAMSNGKLVIDVRVAFGQVDNGSFCLQAMLHSLRRDLTWLAHVVGTHSLKVGCRLGCWPDYPVSDPIRTLPDF